MSPHELAASYDQVAERWSSGRFDPQNGVAQHERALSFLLTAEGAALDVGCGGSGRLIDLMRSRGLDPEGIDLSAEMLRLARARHPDVIFHHEDICEWEPQTRYAFISAWDSIWHVPLARQESVLRKLCSALVLSGVLIFTAGGVEHPDERKDQNMGVPMYHASIGVPRILSLIHDTGCSLKHFEYDQYPQTHVYFIVRRA